MNIYIATMCIETTVNTNHLHIRNGWVELQRVAHSGEGDRHGLSQYSTSTSSIKTLDLESGDTGCSGIQQF